jgi:protein TonB
MPRELFSSSVVALGPPARRAELLPASIAVHAAVIAVFVMLPMLADSTLPPIPDRLSVVFRPPPIIPVIPAARPAGARRQPVSTPAPAPSQAAPAEAPSALPAVDLPGRRFGPAASHGDPLAETGIADGDMFGMPIALPPPPPARTARVGGQVTPPVKIVDVKPVYPAVARQVRVEGTVLIDASIDEHGRVTAARVSRSVPLLDQAALTAVRQWVFTPARLNGQPVGVSITVTVEFRLER